ncbi:hypothetical protein BDC45DRAFT_449965 [Circinella umbellata]|nr:hypothetical protein BDC45DRAFT_449965 [Circinella umbellata]
MLRRNTPPPLSTLSQQRVPNTEPVSPGAISTASFMSSFSWVADKSSTELTALLKNAYSSLREKDKDLALAAEIGKSLLDNNMSLKSKYEDLLQQVNQCNQNYNDDDYNDATMRLISSQNAREALIEALERKNTEMQHMLDSALNESAATGQANEKQARKLQNEIDLLKSNLECAVYKIQELEESRNARQERAAARLNQNNNNDGPNQGTPYLCNEGDDDRWIAEELAEKMAQMQSENESLAYAKNTIEDKLQKSLSDLDNLRQQFHHFQFTQQGYDNLQEAYQRQFKHIEELTTSLEDHRTILSRLRDRGIGWSPKPSPSPSECGSSSFMVVASSAVRNWHIGSSDSESCLSLTKLRDVASLTEHNLAPFYRAPAEYALETLITSTGFKENSIVQEAARYIKSSANNGSSNSTNIMDFDMFSPGGSGSVYDSYNLYPRLSSELLFTTETLHDEMPSGISDSARWILRGLFRGLCQWCRFSLVLVAAILINLWQGPDAIMEK